MHTIRRKARHAAWRLDDPPPYAIFNPFQRNRSAPVPRRLDEESGPGSSDDLNTEHRASSRLGLSSYAPPRRVDTAPTLCTTTNDLVKAHLKHATAEPDLTGPGEGDVFRSSKGFGFWPQFKAIFGSWFSLLLPLIPIGFALRYTNQNAIAVFCVNFLAIIPSTVFISYGLEELSLRVGSGLGLLLDQTFSNAAQLISSILLLKTRQIKLLQISLLGSMLANLLLMTGIAFLIGGVNYDEQYYSVHVAQALGMFLILAVLSLLVPTTSRLLADTTNGAVEVQSRGISVIIVISYLLWLLFQYPNPAFFKGAGTQKGTKRRYREPTKEGMIGLSIAAIGAGSAAHAGGSVNDVIFNCDLINSDDEEHREPRVNTFPAILTMAIPVVLLFFNSMFATDSIQGLLLKTGLTETFVGIVILPTISLSPTAVFSATKDKMDICLSLTLEKCIQTALMVVPLTVIVAWCMGINGMTLEFGGFSVATLFASVLIVTYVIQKGSTNWLVGALLVKVFIIISLSAYFVQ